KNYRVLQGNYRDRDLLIARTGYTGEDGFELYLPAERAAELWQQLTEAGGQDLTPCGLACRDTLRLEAGMPLYGHEIDRDLPAAPLAPDPRCAPRTVRRSAPSPPAPCRPPSAIPSRWRSSAPT